MAVSGRTLKRILIPLAAVPVILMLAYGFTRDPRMIPSPLVGKPAPAFKLKLFDGKTFDMARAHGKVVVVNFFASWCLTCIDEAPRLEEAWNRYKDRGVVFVGIDYQDTDAAGKAYVKQYHKTYMTGRDADSSIALDYGVYGVPETFFVSREGIITHKQIGEIQMNALVQNLDQLLGD